MVRLYSTDTSSGKHKGSHTKQIGQCPAIPGYISSFELRDALTGSDLFLFLSHEETEGIALLEALAMKIPALVRDIEIYKDRFKTGEAIYKANKTIDFKKTN